jgi:WD40 repeat protein
MAHDEPRARPPDEPGPSLPPAESEEDRSLSALLAEVASAPARAPAPAGPRLEPGTVVGRFELVRELGRGGFGVVFEARDRELGRRVAFKAMRPARRRGASLEQPLREEAEAAARLNHPNVVTLHDHGLVEGTPYLILELLEGETLHARLKRGALPPAEAIRIAIEVGRGLVHAHGQGVVHRDLKPGNVFLCAGGGVKLLDFGLARLLDRASLSGGTPAYMAPEQLRGEPGDGRADVFAAAVLLFQMLSGALPYRASRGEQEVLRPGPPPRLPLPDAPPELAALLAGALSKDPATRPQTAQALLDGLEAVSRAYAGRAVAEARATRRRRLRRAALAGAALAAAVATAAALLALRSRAEAERALWESRVASAAEGASDPLVAALLMAELGDDPPPRALEIARRVLESPVPLAVIEPLRGGLSMATSPDGALVAAGLADGGVGVSPADGAGPVRVLRVEGGGQRTNAIAFAPAGELVLSAGHGGELRIYSLRGAPARVEHLGDAPIAALAVSPRGDVAAAGGLDGRLWLVDLRGGAPPREVPHGGALLHVAFSPDGQRLATACADGFLRILSTAGAPLARVATPGGAVLRVRWSPRGDVLAAGSEDGVARVYGPGGEGPLRTLGAPGGWLGDVAFDPAGRLALGSSDGTVLVEATPGAPPLRLSHRGPAHALAFSRDGSRLAVLAAGVPHLWAPHDAGRPPLVLRGHFAADVAFSPDGTRLYTRGKDGVRVWSTEDPAERGVLRGHRGLVDTVRWTRDGARLVTAGHDGTVRIWPLRGGGTPRVIEDPGRGVHAADLDPEERLLAVASEDGTVRLHAADGTRLLAELRGHARGVLSVAFSPDGRWLASAALDGTVRLWDPRGEAPPRVVSTQEAGVTSVTWSADGRELVAASQLDATVRVIPVGGGEPLVIRADRGVFRAGVTPDGRLVYAAEENGPLRLFDREGKPVPSPLPSPPEGLWAAAFAPGGHRLALTALDGVVRVYPADGRGEPLVLRGHEGGVGHAAFSPDGSELATGSADGTARIWTVTWGRMLDRLHAATSACLPVPYRVQLLGEPERDAEARTAACHRAHGREPPAPEPAPARPPAARAGPPPAPSGG